jgi:16S rRNA (uracil1498-N3)-methyltransferase
MNTNAKAHAFVADLDAPELDRDDRHHFARVLRLRRGDTITVSDGGGRWRPCIFDDPLEPSGSIEHEPPAEPQLAVAFAVVKGERTEWAVQKLVELGVDAVIPFVSDRSVVRWDQARSGNHHLRLAKVARQAAMQSRRSTLPQIEPLRSFAEVAARPGVALADANGVPPSLSWPKVIVGPEGGWSAAERDSDLPRVRLAPRVLRSETAAVVAGALLVALREGLVISADGHAKG